MKHTFGRLALTCFLVLGIVQPALALSPQNRELLEEDFASRGEIVFDLDESLQLEMLNGNDDHVEYFIPFGAIKEIAPMNRKESKVTLSNGESFLFDGKVDVNEDNDGVLVYFKTASDKPKYIAWSEVQKITFE